jgi:hypothetical protein
MNMPAYVYGFDVHGYHTETAATAITENIPGQDGKRLALLAMEYLAAATAHLASFQYAKDASGHAGSSRNTADGVVLSGQKDITCVVAPLSPAGAAAAASDVIAYQLTDGTWEFNTVASLAGSVITLTNNITGVDAGGGATAIADGGKVLIMGIVGDGAVLNISLTASVVTRVEAPHIVHPYVGEPFFLTIDNATNAGFLESLVMGYVDK